MVHPNFSVLISRPELVVDHVALVLEAAYDGIFVCDAENRFVYVNPALEAITGIPRSWQELEKVGQQAAGRA